MKINSITVGGFKNLNTTKLELDNICAIISPNNYGKSNLCVWRWKILSIDLK